MSHCIPRQYNDVLETCHCYVVIQYSKKVYVTKMLNRIKF